MANTVTLAFAGDSKSLEKTFNNVGASAKSMAGDLDKAGGDAKRFGSTMDNMNDKIGNSESKFMGAADLLDGLGGAFGLPLGEATNMARSFADLAGGLSSVVGPALTKIIGMLGFQTAATAAQTAATGSATAAQTGLNAALLANPVGLVIAAIVALAGAFILAWKHSETFRDVVRGAFSTVRGFAEGFWNFLASLPGKISSLGGQLFDIIVWPYKTAFNAIARTWNNTVGQLSFSVPSWVPGLGGKGWGMPKLPVFHNGGIVPGNPGTPVPILAMAGERVTRAGESSGGGITIIVQGNVLDGRQLGDLVHTALLQKKGRGGTLGLT